VETSTTKKTEPVLATFNMPQYIPASFSGQLIELEPDHGQAARSAKTSPASLRKQVTVAEGEKASAAVLSSVTGA